MISLALTILLALLQVGDHYTTRTIINNGGRELNPIMAKAFEHFGMKRTLIVKGIGVTALGYFIGTQSIELLAALVVFYIGIIIHNWRSMPK